MTEQWRTLLIKNWAPHHWQPIEVSVTWGLVHPSVHDELLMFFTFSVFKCLKTFENNYLKWKWIRKNCASLHYLSLSLKWFLHFCDLWGICHCVNYISLGLYQCLICTPYWYIRDRHLPRGRFIDCGSHCTAITIDYMCLLHFCPKWSCLIDATATLRLWTWITWRAVR